MGGQFAEPMYYLRPGDIPYQNGLVLSRCRQQRAVGRKSHRAGGDVTELEFGGFFLGSKVPETDGLVAGRRQLAPAGMETQGSDGLAHFVAPDAFAGREVPQTDLIAGVGGGEE